MTLRYLLRSCMALAFLLTTSGVSAQSDLVITGIVDGPLPTGIPKAIELYVVNDIADLSAYAVNRVSNGGGSDGVPDYAFSGSASAGDYIYAASDADGFMSFFGFAPTFSDAPIFVNGDDAIELYQSGSLVDVVGDPDNDGTGLAWEYTDGWAYRMSSTGPSATFDANEWTYSGVDALDDETTNASAATPFPIGTYGGSGGSALILTAIVDGPLPTGIPKMVELYVTRDIADLSAYALTRVSNGGGSTGMPDYALSGSASAGDFLYAASDVDGFTSFFGFAPTFGDAPIFVNGDDSIELYLDGEVVDVVGDVDVDGTDQAWEYTDGWAYRISGTGPSATFGVTDWTYSGRDALDDETTNASAATPVPIGMYSTTPSTGPEMFTTLALSDFEVPEDPDSDARGGITVMLDGTMMTVTGAFAYLESDYNTNIGAHLHGGSADENGPVRYALTPTLDADNRGGFFAAGANMFNVRETFADSLRAGLVYFNLHTVDNASGEIRGQLGMSADELLVELSGDQEVPAFATDASGEATVTVEGTMVTVTGSFEGLTGDYAASHVHAGAFGANGPVAFALNPTVPVSGPRSGMWMAENNVFEVSTTFADSLRAGLAYINVHSSASPSGEIRGQIGFADEMDIEPMAIADVRAGGEGQEVVFVGVVTRAQGRSSFVQDETAGISLFQSAGPLRDAIDSGAVAAGDSLAVMGMTSAFNGLFQISPVTDFEVISRGNDLPMYQRVTLTEIATDGEAYESELIEIRNLTITDDGDGLFDSGSGSGQTYVISDGTQTDAVTLRVPGTDQTLIGGQPIPAAGNAIFRGILGQFDSSDEPRDAGYQISPIGMNDVVSQGDASMLVINEILYDPADELAGDANGDGTRDGAQDEFVEIVNSGTENVDLGNFVIEDEASFGSDDATFVRHRFPVGTVLEAGQAIVVFGGGTPTGSFGTSIVQTSSNNGLGFNNGGDTVTLADDAITSSAGGNVIAAVTYDNAVQNEAIARVPDLTGDFAAHSTNPQNPVLFSPGVSNLTGGGGGFPSASEETPDGTLVMTVANPLRSSARVRFELPASGETSLTLYDALGRQVALLADGEMAAGEHGATLNASALAPGVYILRLVASGTQLTKTLTVVR